MMRRVSSFGRLFSVGFAVTALLLVGACTGDDATGMVIEPPVNNACELNDECSPGYICNGGACVVGECDPNIPADSCDVVGEDGGVIGRNEYCCRRYQQCNFALTCVAVDGPIGNQCDEAADCPDPGQFCSGGNCYDAAGRTPCTGDFQCAPDERCDRQAFLCVPDQGGCVFCSDFPELCCESDQLCDLETGFCVGGEPPECTPETVAEDCLPNRQCNQLGQCVQCIIDDDCGPGTACNTGTGNCYSIINACVTDDDCSAPKRCAPATQECITPQCEGDAQCQADDTRTRCDLSTFTCYLPAAQCTENDEPNNGIASATDLGGLSGAGTLCRGDVDYLRFPVVANKRYRVNVQFPDYNVGGNVVAILDGNGALEVSDTLASFENSTTVTAVTGLNETATSYYVRITGSGSDGDFWAYTVSIVEEEAPDMVDCQQEIDSGIEPNDTFATAYAITAEGSRTFARCTQSDRDYYHVTVPPQHGVKVTVEFDNSAGDMAVRLFDGPNESDSVDYSDGAGTSTEIVEASEGPSEFWVRVALWSATAQGVDGQPYTLTVEHVGRPEACNPDVGEPGDDAAGGAQTLALDTTTPGVRCVSIDHDWYTFTVPANYGGSLALGFTHSQGDLRLDLYNDQQTLISSSNSSNSQNGVESIEIPFAATERTYLAQVRLHSSSSQIAQAYTITASTYDASVCVASEPSANNNMVNATCVGPSLQTTFPCASGPLAEPVVAPSAATCTATPAAEGCGTVCGVNDEDWYRVGKLNDGQLLRARLRYDPGEMGANGRLGLALARANADLSSVTLIEYNPNTALSGDLELLLNAPTVNPAFAREYAVIVMPEGTEGFSALPYRLDINVGEPCIADTAEPNDDPSQSTFVRQNGAPGVDYDETLGRTLCGFDTDVYELFAFTNETVTVNLGGPPGLVVNIGSRPADITDEAPTLAAGMDVAGPCPVAIPPGLDQGDDTGDAGVPDDGGTEDPAVSCVTASYTSPGIQQLYLTVKRLADDVASIGPYNLQVVVDSP